MTISAFDGVVGRDAELDLIDAARRRGAAAVVIGGAAGVGKTRLVREAVERARQEGWGVEPVLATASAREIPLGACAGLWDASGDESSEAAASRVIASVRSRATGPTLLVVDDAHLLDPSSAHVIAVLARDDAITCMLTVRTSEPVHDAVRGLWKDTDGERVELQALSLAETVALAETLLGGRLEHATGRRLFAQCEGNVLFLRELIAALSRQGGLDEDHGIWRWSGVAVASARLDELIDDRIGLLAPDELHALQHVTFAEPIELGVVEALGVSAAVEALERAGLVDVAVDGRRSVIRLNHPLFGEAIRLRAGALQARRVYASLADALGNSPARRRGDDFRLAVWQLNAGTAHDAQSLIAAAREARALGDSDLAERLATAAADSGGGLEARAIAAQSLMDRGDDDAALVALQALVHEDGPDLLRATVAELLAAHLATSFGRIDEARAVLDEALASVRDDQARALLEALQVAMHPHSARHRIDAPSGPGLAAADDAAQLLTWLGTAHADMTAGRFETVETMSHEMWLRANRLSADRPEALLWVTVLRWYALVHCGKLGDAEALALDALNLSGDHPYGRTRAWFIDMLGTLALLRGDAAGAVSHLEEAVAVRRVDDRGSLTGSLLALTVAHALLGNADGADAAFAESTTSPTSVLAPFVSAPRADAARLAARGHTTNARTVIVEHARDCRDNGLALFELWAWHDAARYGAPGEAADGLEAMIDRVDAPLPGAFAAVARAQAARDMDGLVTAATRLVEIGLILDAAEAFGAAARRAGEQGNRRLAQRCAAELEALRPQLRGVDTPALRMAPAAGALSEREYEIAALAAAGRRDADIAAELVVSVRTVHAHLRSVYTKLGITSRGQIAAALGQRASERAE
ncbi:MAG TPA: AAA family ATPase [Acidimicrobiia bacterium]|jgi:DNA-binding CsgD family transcriptional regulator